MATVDMSSEKPENQRFTSKLVHRYLRKWCVLAGTASLGLAVLWGCSAGDGDEDPGTDPQTGAADFVLTATLDDRGQASVRFSVPDGTTKLAVTAATSEDLDVRIDEFVDDAGTDYLSPDRRVPISLATEYLPLANTAVAPSRDVDPSVDSSREFLVTASVTGGRGDYAGQDMTFTVNTKQDNNLDAGRLEVNLFLVGEVGDDPAIVDAINQGITEFAAIYLSQAGISISVNKIVLEGNAVIPSPFSGSSFFLSASKNAPAGRLNIFVATDVQESEILGISGGLPGVPVPSPKSGVAVSILNNAGPDGRFSDADIKVLGETMAHEAGHYLGLFHPVDFSGDRNVVTDVDPLSQTPECSSLVDCVANTDLASNLMFAFPIEDGNGGFVRQNTLYPQQRSVMNRYILVD